MSASSHDSPAHQSAHGDHAHAFDGEPVKVLPPDEPRTPGWVPLLGVLLFVLGGVGILLSGDDDAASEGAPEKTTAEARPTQAAAPPAPPPPGAPSALPSVQRLSPEQAKILQQRLDEARARQAAQPGGQPAAPGAQPGQVPPSRQILRPPVPAAPAPPAQPAPGGGAQ